MDDEKKDRLWFKKLFQRSDEKKKGKFPLPWIIFGLIAGLTLMVIGNMSTKDDAGGLPSTAVFSSKEEKEDVPVFGSKGNPPETMFDYESHYENQLRDVLEQIVGVSEVSVMINLAETEKIIYEKNTSEKVQKTDETDREGGKRLVDDVTKDEQLVIIRNGDKEEPLLQRREKPTIRGVLVVANGVDNVQVKAWVVEAVSRVLEVPTHRVSVMPKKMKGE
ncbi:MAG TPA: stage III sporulation protein AG [Bacilli bacterium]|nr:stage III sporulation protein AG [Bacilli bacterium]